MILDLNICSDSNINCYLNNNSDLNINGDLNNNNDLNINDDLNINRDLNINDDLHLTQNYKWDIRVIALFSYSKETDCVFIELLIWETRDQWIINTKVDWLYDYLKARFSWI